QRQRHFPLHPLGERLDRFVVGQFKMFDQISVALLKSKRIESGRKPPDLVDGHPVVKSRAVGHVTDPVPDFRTLLLTVESQNTGCAAVSRQQPQQNFQGRCLAGSIFSSAMTCPRSPWNETWSSA